MTAISINDRTTKDIMGLDDDLPNIVVGCDPGPYFNAFALVARCGCRLAVAAVDYVPVHDLVADAVEGERLTVLDGVVDRSFALVYEKMSTRYGAVPGAFVYDTCRNSGVVLAAAAVSGASAVYAVSTSEWRTAFGGTPHMKDSEVRREIIEMFGDGVDAFIRLRGSNLKLKYKLDKPVAGHLRDAVGVAVGAYLMRRRGVPVKSHAVWRAADAE